MEKIFPSPSNLKEDNVVGIIKNGQGGVGDVVQKMSTSKGEKSDYKERKLIGLKKKPRYWTEEEDKLLAAAVKTVEKEGLGRNSGDNMWKKVAAHVPNRAWRECLQRWTKVLVPGLKKGKWSPEEDKALLELVNAQLKINPSKICWPEVSKGMGFRSCKQCRERWINHLDPNVKKGEWTPEEDEILLNVGQKYPAKWAKIARHIPGRTENTVKVRWKILKRQEWKPEEDRELLRLTAMYPRQWRTIANSLSGRNERSIKQRLHILSKEKPETFSFLQNLPSPKSHKKLSLSRKRVAVAIPEQTSISRKKKSKLDSNTENDRLSVKSNTSIEENKSAVCESTSGLDMLRSAIEATSQAQKEDMRQEVSFNSAMSNSAFGGFMNSAMPWFPPMQNIPQINNMVMQQGFPFFGVLPFVYNDPTAAMAYITAFSQLGSSVNQENPSAVKKTT